MRLFIVASILTFAGVAASSTQPEAATPAERSIAQARETIRKNPDKPEGYNLLALAQARRARESSDVTYYTQAAEAIRKSLQIAPDNFGARKAEAWILLGQHEFAKARELAMTLNKRVPDDLLVYGFLTDANAELGNYDEAEKACNWMLKLRPGNIPALTRAAYLREIFGDLDGAVNAMRMAFEATSVSESEDRAWILNQIAHLKLTQGKTDEAEKVIQEALTLFPDYHYALGQLAKVRIAQKKYDEAVSLLRKRYQGASHAENLYDLADALELAGQKDAAQKVFDEFEAKAMAESAAWDNANQELIAYYADHAH